MASYSAYVQKYPDLIAHYNKNIAGSGKTIEQWGQQIGKIMWYEFKIVNYIATHQ